MAQRDGLRKHVISPRIGNIYKVTGYDGKNAKVRVATGRRHRGLCGLRGPHPDQLLRTRAFARHISGSARSRYAPVHFPPTGGAGRPRGSRLVPGWCPLSISLGLGAVRQVSRLISPPHGVLRRRGARSLRPHPYLRGQDWEAANRPPGSRELASGRPSRTPSRDFTRNQPVEPARKLPTYLIDSEDL